MRPVRSSAPSPLSAGLSVAPQGAPESPVVVAGPAASAPPWSGIGPGLSREGGPLAGAASRAAHALDMQRSVGAVHAGGASDAGAVVLAAATVGVAGAPGAGQALVSGRTGTAPALALECCAALRQWPGIPGRLAQALGIAQRNLQRTDYATGLLLQLKQQHRDLHGRDLPLKAFAPRLDMEVTALVQSLAMVAQMLRRERSSLVDELAVAGGQIDAALASFPRAVDELIRQARRFDPGFVPDAATVRLLEDQMALPG